MLLDMRVALRRTISVRRKNEDGDEIVVLMQLIPRGVIP